MTRRKSATSNKNTPLRWYHSTKHLKPADVVCVVQRKAKETEQEGEARVKDMEEAIGSCREVTKTVQVHPHCSKYSTRIASHRGLHLPYRTLAPTPTLTISFTVAVPVPLTLPFTLTLTLTLKFMWGI